MNCDACKRITGKDVEATVEIVIEKTMAGMKKELVWRRCPAHSPKKAGKMNSITRIVSIKEK